MLPITRATELLELLERRVERDPFHGLDRRAAHALTDELYRMKQRVREAYHHVPDDDPDKLALNLRLLASDRAIDRFTVAWGRAALEGELRAGWHSIRADFVGWEEEQVAAGARPLEAPSLPRTRAAIVRIRSLLADPRAEQIRFYDRGTPAIEALFRHAEDTLEAATAKLHDAFNRVLEAAERLPVPDNRVDLERPRQLARWAEDGFAGTRHLARNRARALSLAERWRAAAAARDAAPT